MTVVALAALDVDNLALRRGERILFRDLGFSLGAGEALMLLGPNGVGKTSLLRAIAGFLQPLAGSIKLRTRDSAHVASDEERGRYVGWLGHQDGAKPQMTAGEVLAFFARLFDRKEPIEDRLAEVGLGRVHDLPVQYLSAGQKRRLALARLRLSQRPLWLLDEPLAALDAAGKTMAAAFVAEHCRSGGIAIAATHEPLGLDCRQLALGGGP